MGVPTLLQENCTVTEALKHVVFKQHKHTPQWVVGGEDKHSYHIRYYTVFGGSKVDYWFPFTGPELRKSLQ